MHGKLVMFGDETLTCVTSRLLVQRQQMTGLSSFSFHIFLDYLFIQISREDGGRTFCVGLLRLVHHLGCSLINSNIPPPPPPPPPPACAGTPTSRRPPLPPSPRFSSHPPAPFTCVVSSLFDGRLQLRPPANKFISLLFTDLTPAGRYLSEGMQTAAGCLVPKYSIHLPAVID